MKRLSFCRAIYRDYSAARGFAGMVGALLAAHAIPSAHGAPLNWDGAISGGPNGGNGTWDSNSTGNWWDGAADVVWPNAGTANDAVFGGTLGAVTVVAVTANGLTFTTSGYTLASGTLTLNGTTPTISAGTGIAATIGSDIAGSVGLTKADSGTLTINASSSYGGTTAVSGGTLILKKAADTDANLVNSTVVVIDNATLKPDATTRNLYVGTDAVAHSLTAQNAGQINNFTGLYLGTTATSNGNTVLFTGTGTVVSCVNNTGGNKNLRVGDAGVSNTLTVAAGASFSMPKGNGSNDHTIGNLATATLNSMTVTGTNSSYTSTAPMNVGALGNSNQMTVSAGGSANTQRLLIGTGASATGNSVTVTGTNSKYTVSSTTNAIFEIGSVAGANSNSMTLAAGGGFTFSGSGTSRNFSIGKAGNNNYFAVTGAGSALNVTYTLPIGVGGVATGATFTDGGSGNHLDLASGGAMVTNTSVYVGGTASDSAINLGDGSAISSATVGATAGFTAGVLLKNANGRLNFNSGRLIAGANGALVSGAGQIVLNGPAYFSTTQAASTIGSVISGSGSLSKEGTGTLTLASGTNTYSGDTNLVGGILVLSSANPNNDSAAVTIDTSVAMLNLNFVGDDVVGSLVINGVTMAAGTYGSTSSSAPPANQNDSAFAGTGTLTVSGASPVTYASWASSMGIPGALPSDDYDHDGVANAVEMVLGGDPKTVMDAGLLPQLALVTNPVGVPAGDYLEFTYRRTDLSVSAGVAAVCETATDLLGPWTTAADGVNGVVVLVDNDYAPFGAATARVRVYVPRGANVRLFGRLHVTVP